jgi:hypothetical protein
VLKPDDWIWKETPNVVLSNGGLTLTGKEGVWAASRGTIGWTHGVHEWVVRIDAGNSISVGVSLENINSIGGNSEISCTLSCSYCSQNYWHFCK